MNFKLANLTHQLKKILVKIFKEFSSKMMHSVKSHHNTQVSLAKMTKSNLGNMEDLAQPLVVVPPDGGWGWVVTLAAFIISFICDGTAYAFGVFLEDISVTLEVPPTKVAIVNSVMTGFYSIVGPICCALINRYGFRKIAFIGGTAAALSFFASSFLTTLEPFIFIIGVLGGSGCNFLIIPALIAVGFYFEKWRALAVALTVCGSSLGMIAFPPIFTKLLKGFKWQDKFRILGGLYMFSTLLTFTFKPIKPLKAVISSGEIKKVQFTSSTSIGTFNEDATTTKTIGVFQKYRNNRFYPTVSQVSFGSNTTYRRDLDDQSTFMEIVPSYSANSIKTVGQGTLYTVTEEEAKPCTACCRNCKECCVLNFIYCYCCGVAKESTVNRPMYRDDIFYTSSVFFLPQYSRDNTHAGPATRKSASIAYHMSVTRTATQKDLAEQQRCVCCPEAVRRTFATMLDVQMLKLPSFIIISISGFFTVLGLFSPFIFLVDRSIQMDIPKSQALLLLSSIGIANTVGRILCGIVSFFPLWDVTTIIYVSLTVSGGSLIVSNYLYTFGGQLACVVIFGVTLAGFTALKSIMLVELYGLENLTNCFGLNMLFQGIGCFLGVPIASVLKETTNSYDASFLFSGCSIVLSAILLLPVHKLIVWEKLRRRKVSFRL